ncbi:hypothetical protein SAMN05216416_1704, partial [Streptococcus equinus]
LSFNLVLILSLTDLSFLTGYFRNPHVWFVLFSFQRSLSHSRQLLYSIKFETLCQHLFSRNFQLCFKFVTAALSNNSYISLAFLLSFVKKFFELFSKPFEMFAASNNSLFSILNFIYTVNMFFKFF